MEKNKEGKESEVFSNKMKFEQSLELSERINHVDICRKSFPGEVVVCAKALMKICPACLRLQLGEQEGECSQVRAELSRSKTMCVHFALPPRAQIEPGHTRQEGELGVHIGPK